MSIRIRLVLMTMLILILCCVGLTVIINYAATEMAVQVAEMTLPAQSILSEENELTLEEQAISMEAAPQNMARQQQIISSFYRNTIVYMLFIIAVGGGIMYFFSKRILLPLATFNEKIKSSTVANLADTMDVPSTNDEITELTISYNKMMARLQAAFLFQQQFSANVAHELRTPLTILQTKIDVFYKKRERTIEEHQRLISDLKQQIVRLSDIVQTLLEITNADSISDKEEIILSDLMDNVLLDLFSLSKSKKINMSSAVQDLPVYGNIDALYQVFYNIIENSIKYNIESGSVAISSKQTTSTTIIEICDSGIGIAKEEQKHIFESFFRVDESRARSIGGAGLGLAIVKTIIDKHNGSITVCDNTPQGTCFRITLPLK